MALARKQDISFFRGDDFKVVLSLIGFDLTGETAMFNIATAPEATALIAAKGTILDVIEDSDGVPTTIMQAFKPVSDVEAALASLGASDPGADVTLYYNFRVSALAGDDGASAGTTLVYGACLAKGSI